MNKTIGVLAHVDAGKTTFCEQLLYHTDAIRKRGRVDSKDTFLDNHSIERERGITIFSEQGIFKYNNSKYYLIDTPGHIDFSPDMERSISIMDYAIVIISAVEKIQSHTKTIFRLLKKHNIPTIFFINKIDRTGSDVEGLIKDIKVSFTNDVINISESLSLESNKDKLETNLIEFIAERDEILLQQYIDGNYDEELWIEKLIDMIKYCEIYPIMEGSALQDIGVKEFIAKLDFLTTTSYEEKGDFIGKVFKIKYDENQTKIIYLKALQGKLKVKDELFYTINEEDIKEEKVNEIRVYNSNKYITTKEVNSGEIFSICGNFKTKPLNYLTDSKDKLTELKKLQKTSESEMIPTLKSKVMFDNNININEVLNIFRMLEDEEPALNVIWEETLKEIHVHVMGKIQLEILEEILKDRFNLEVEFGPCEILYKETIASETIGYGHFEPLKHYAEVHLKIEPSKRNEKITFDSKAHVEDLIIGHQNLIKTHLFEKEHRGILGGYPLTDLKITLLTGRAHNKHTSGGDFREATLRALRQGLEQVENILLEPYYKFRIEADIEYLGRILSDIQKMSGEFEAPIMDKERCIIVGRGPVATFMNYSLELVSFSRGSGSINFIFDGYDKCHNEEEVLEKRNYNKDSDIDYTSNSIFCSKGQGYVVPGKEAKEYMHCLK